MKKKIISLCLVVCLLATAIVGGTLAYFTDTESATNTITIGNVEIELLESKYHRGAPTGYLSITDQPNPTTDKDIEADADVYEDYLAEATLMPFNFNQQFTDNTIKQTMFEECTVAKNAYIKNTGKNDCFVRVVYKVPVEIARYLDLFYVGTQFITDTDNVAIADARTLNNDDATEPMITNVNTTAKNFVEQVDKQKSADKKYFVAEFIYAERLEPDEFTLYSPVSKITLVPTVTNEIITELKLADRAFDIVVEAHAIQADGFTNAVAAFAAFDGQVKEVKTNAANATELNAALAAGENVVMSSDITINANAKLAEGATFDGNGNTLTKDNLEDVAKDYKNAGIEPTGGTIQNVTIMGDNATSSADGKTYGFRAIYNSGALEGDLTVKNATLIGTYALNVGDLNGKKLTVKDSVVDGWFSYGGTTGTAEFTNVDFVTGATPSTDNFDLRRVRPYGNATTFTNCDFSSAYKFDTAGVACTITFDNCTIGGVPVTADNVKSFIDETAATVTVVVDGTQVVIN